MPLITRAIFCMLSAFLIFAGCGYNPKEGGDKLGSVVEKGTVECLYSGCHDSFVATAGFNPASSWSGEVHSNPDNLPAFALSEESCVGCHNPVEDGRNDSAFLFTSGFTPGPPDRPIIGCEACHGAGMEHYAYNHTGPGDTAPPVLYNPPYDPAFGDSHYFPAASTVSASLPNPMHLSSCGPCHSPDQHAGGSSLNNVLANQYPEWFRVDGQGFSADDGHSDSLIVESDQGFMTSTIRGVPCAACHTVEGFVTYYAMGNTSWAMSQTVIDRLITETGDTDIEDPSNTPGSAALSQVSCVSCHPSHDPNNLIRLNELDYSGAIGDTVRRATLCITCHNVRGLVADVGSGQSGTGGLEIPRHPQKEIFEGMKNSANDSLRGVEFPGFTSTDSDHAGTDNIPDACSGCHYLVVSDESLLEQPQKATTGHFFVPRLENCLNVCHLIDDFLLSDGTTASFEDSTIASFDFGSIYYSVTGQPGADHDRDGTVEPFQSEIQGMLNDLKETLIGAGVTFDDEQGLFDLTQMASRTATERAAAYNYDYIVEDKSLGYHNPIYAVDLLAASISALP